MFKNLNEIKTTKALLIIILILLLCCGVMIFALFNGAEITIKDGVKFIPKEQNYEIVQLTGKISNLEHNTVSKGEYDKVVADVDSLKKTAIRRGLLSPNQNLDTPEEICGEIERILDSLCDSKSQIDNLIGLVELEISNRGYITTKDAPSTCRYTYYIQTIFNALGYELDHNTTTTYQAVHEFQRDHDITPDGLVGINTWAKVREEWRIKKTLY